MSTSARRHTRRALVALVAAATAASLLVPTGASAVVNETSAQRFGGQDRYETSLAVAEVYLAELADNPDRAPTGAAIVVSGEDRHAGFGLPAAALASAFDAPILLTPSDRLHEGVGRFIEVNDIELVLVVGGPDVVSTAVESELADRTDNVRRLSGDDVYGTSVSVAAAVGPIPGSAGEWGSRGRTALLANGVRVADALVAGPLSYHGSHPLLLTSAAALNEQVSEYLDRSDVQHVVMFGGQAALSSAVESAVRAKGITTSRLAGPDRYGTAAAVARQLLGSGRPHPCFDGSVIGLAAGRQAADALSSGPLLGERCAPLLLGEQRLVPRSLLEVLTGGVLLGGTDNRLELTVFGGTAALSQSVVTTARNLARRGQAFSATVDANEGSKLFRVTFSVDVRETDENGNPVATSPARYTVNGLALYDPDTDPSGTGRAYAEITLRGRTVTVELVEPLAAGNTITVIGETNTPQGRSQIAVDDALPALETVFYRVPRAPPVADFEGPQMQIVAIAGQAEIVVSVAEQALRVGDRLRNDVTVNARSVHELTVVDKLGNPKTVTFATAAEDCPLGGEVAGAGAAPPPSTGGDIGVACYEDPATHGARYRYTASVAPALAEGDVITVAKGALADRRGNPSPLTRSVVAAPADNGENGVFGVVRAAVGNVLHTRPASLFISNAPAEGNRRLQIDARSTGAAAGAAGNGWRVYPYVDIDAARVDPAQRVVDVGVDPVHRVLSYTIIDRFATLAELAAAMNADAGFRRHFSARVVSRTGVPLMPIDSAAGAAMSGGASTVGLRVHFTDHVKALDGAAQVSSPASRAQFAAPDDLANLFLDGSDASDARVLVSCLRRGAVVYLHYEVRSVAGSPLSNVDALLPKAGTATQMPAGVATSFADAPNRSEPRFHLRSDPTIPAAVGYPDNRIGDAAGLHCGGPS